MSLQLLAAILRPVKLKWSRWNAEIRFTGLLTVFIYALLLSYSLLFRHRRTPNVVVKYAPNPVQSLSSENEASLYKIFKRADTTADNRLSLKELSWIIHRQVMKHIQESLRNNFKNFFLMDTSNKNGQVDWSEYSDNKFKGLDSSDRSVKEMISEARAAWSEAARSNPESLNIDEFLGFTHPESSHSVLAQSSEEALRKYDEDGDSKISLSEFCNPFVVEEAANRDSKEERRKLFSNILDTNGDGFADKREILLYLDPKSSHWSEKEASNLLRLLDTNQDGFVDWRELQNQSGLVLKSQIIHPEISLHDSSLNFSL
eukprot:TRINITY_DN18306_c0_g1_i1.p1 TRINITY_DN18306_c0_g1~~TRINITY_DN18306_c0_g1_i1.p1  ORF type:complete len:316 (+),score=108.36 TRINITY_DN18306_c0_g1_i1:42-989(+)